MTGQKLPVVPNFPELEKKWLSHWDEHGTMSKYTAKNKDSGKKFSFIDGPITANNPMGVHHGWGRTYKDLWQKFHNLLGFKQRFQNGFDCQGLWVEVEVEKELKLKSKKDIENLVPGDRKASVAKFVSLCKERVHKYANIQTQQSRRLGYFMNWDNSYFTMADENNYMIWHFLKVCHENGWIYKGRESVPWCPRCETAISQHEMLTEDYKEATHESIYLELPLQDREKEFLLVWTTTPWTIPANIAVAVDEDLEYSLVEGTTGDRYWIVKEAIGRVFGTSRNRTVKTVKGRALVGLKYKGPFDELDAVQKVARENPKTFHKVIATDNSILPVTTTEGTGLVHTAVSAGTEDFKLGQKYGLPMIPVIADDASYLPHMGFLAGQNAKTNPRLILDYLQEREKTHGENWVFKIEDFTHRYPACWRCKTELVWKVADEWYIAMDKKSKNQNPKAKDNQTLRERMIEVAKSIHWIPKFGLERELDWLNNMHDWLISKKNRYWGLALPIYECEKCGRFEVIGGRDELKKRAVKGWDKFEGHTPHKPWIDEVQIDCTYCQSRSLRIGDVGNPWLDAGIVPYSTLIDPKTGRVSYTDDRKYWQEWFPADFITESFPGQFKNWFYALIAMSTVLERTRPFKTVLGYGTLLDEKGRPMHKSWGNMIEFNEGADRIGVDVMRWLYVRHDPKKNLLFGFQKAEETKREFHIPLWNILKFFLTYSELDGWKKPSRPGKDLDKASLALLDRWALSRLKKTEKQVKKYLSDFDPEKASGALEELVADISQWYVRLSRNRVWNNSADDKDKEAFYSALYYILHSSIILLSQFLPFFSEEIYSLLGGEQASVHLESWPVIAEGLYSRPLNEDMKKVRAIAELGHSERKRRELKVRQPLAGAVFTLDDKLFPQMSGNLAGYEDLLSQELNIKKVTFQKGAKSAVKLDTTITEALRWEGEIRDLIRKIQKERQTLGYNVKDTIKLVIPKVPEQYVDLIKQKVLATEIELKDVNKIEIK